MKSRRRLLLLVVLIGVLATTTAALAGTVSWGSAIEVPGTGQVLSVSCSSAGNCAAGGYMDGSQTFVVEETNGVWGAAIEVPGIAALDGGGFGQVTSVSCVSPGNCAAGGRYSDASAGKDHAFVVDETNGVWGTAIEVPGTAALGVAGAAVRSVSCRSTGDCVAGGDFFAGFDKYGDPANLQAFMVSEHGGVWRTARKVPGSGASHNSAGSSSCAGSGYCVVAGDGGLKTHGFVVAETNGTWGKLTKVLPTAVNSVSCGSPGNCAAVGGRYLAVEKHGKWGTAINVPGLAALNRGRLAEVLSVSCASAGNCSAGGVYTDSAHRGQGFVVSAKNGKWGKAIKVPGTAALNVGRNAAVGAVSCAGSGNCAAIGIYTDGSHRFQAFVVAEQSGVWGKAVEVPGTAALEAGGGTAGANSISCVGEGGCAIGGYYVDGSNHQAAFVTTP